MIMHPIPREFSHPVPIGQGAFSSVYRVWQQKLERHAVIKIIFLKRGTSAEIIEKEARVLASIRLPCVPHIYDVKRSGRNVVIIMEWIRGVPLSSLMEQPMSSEVSIAVASDIIRGLALLHDANIVHGDLKPENILVTADGRIFFVDFGFSFKDRINSRDSGVIRGTPPYMAPELWSCQGVIDHKKADVYALGIVLQNMLGKDLPAFAAELVAGDPARRPEACALLEKNWREMFPSMIRGEELRAALEPAIEEYTARLLFAGARQLHAKNRKEEAYALLTESLDTWADYPEALDFLQNKFSSPIHSPENKRTVASALIALAVIIALFVAYSLGTRSSPPRIFLSGMEPARDAEGGRLSLLSAPRTVRRAKDEPIALRNSSDAMEASGTLVVVIPQKSGKLFIDKMPISVKNEARPAAILPAGPHRVEWFDSASRRTFGETVGLLPFEKKSISLSRFANGL